VRLDLVARAGMTGKAGVSTYFTNYAATADWHFTLGFVDGHPALLARDPRRPTPQTTYFVLLEWQDGRLRHIRDFRYARYALDGARLIPE
jgi:RNA polymerase sigma-70 factor (ECF subfamily)